VFVGIAATACSAPSSTIAEYKDFMADMTRPQCLSDDSIPAIDRDDRICKISVNDEDAAILSRNAKVLDT
jgi:hypothetical protein